jgi:hypothetical protein
LPGKRVPIRLGIAIKQPVAKARVQLTIAPASPGRKLASPGRQPGDSVTRSIHPWANVQGSPDEGSPCAATAVSAVQSGMAAADQHGRDGRGTRGA